MSASATLARTSVRKTTPVGKKASANSNTGTTTAKARAIAPAKATKGERVVAPEMNEAMLLFVNDGLESLISSWRVVQGSAFAQGKAKPIRIKTDDGIIYSIKGGSGRGIGGGKAAARYAYLVLEEGYTQDKAIAEVTKLFQAMLATQYRFADEYKTLVFESDNPSKATKATHLAK
jgi:hypothetical protein